MAVHIRLIKSMAISLAITFAFYAVSLGYPSVQQQVVQRYIHGVGVEKNHRKAMEWFKKASESSHPQASYNLAVGHLKGYMFDVNPGEVPQLIHKAAAKGIKQAPKVLTGTAHATDTLDDKTKQAPSYSA